MDYIETLNATPIQCSCAAIGAFDGVHTGHQVIFKKAMEGARQANCQAVAITFDPLPAVFFRKIKTDHVLTSLKERISLIKSLGIEQVIVLKFDQQLADVEAAEFMTHVKKAIGLQKLIAGWNFNLGKNRAGTVDVLKEIGARQGFEVEVVCPIKYEGEIISSSNIRKLLKKNEVVKARIFLGRPYTITGKVVHGEHRGKHLGIPTANLSFPGELIIPGNGVYVTRATISKKKYIAVTNVGVHPTFENPLTTPRIEPHLLDTNESFYGKTLRLEFLEFIRPEVKFPDAGALVDQIQLDIQKTRELLRNEP